MGRTGKRKTRDWTLPGTNYVGPGNKLHKGPPRHHNDRVAQIHDFAYDTIEERGLDPYWNYSNADEAARKQFDHSHYSGTLGKAFFGGKRLAWKAGFIGNVDSIEPAKKKKALRRGYIAPRDLSFNNLRTQTETMSAPDGNAGGSGNARGLKETPVDETPRYLPTGPEDYTFAKLPYNAINRFFTNQAYSVDMGFRMTSPYDPKMFTTMGNLPGTITNGGVLAGDPDGGINEKANWFEFYAGMYKYYHVAECHWSVYIENIGGEPLYVHWLYVNEEYPNPLATNTDIMGWEGVRTRILQPQYKGITGNGALSAAEGTQFADAPNDMIDENDGFTGGITNFQTGNHVSNQIGQSNCSLSGTYRPGQYRREINLDSQVENWTSVDTNPTLPERLLLRFKPENPGIATTAQALQRGDQMSFKIWTKINYVVEFKELKAGLRWPVQRQPILVTVQENAFTSTA